jgi:hypothetical protein
VDALPFPKLLLPFERQVLGAIWEILDTPDQVRLAGQISSINKVQRILNWRSIEFYRMRWFKVAPWPSEFQFENLEEFILGTVEIVQREHAIRIKVWSVGGHVFTLESSKPMRPLKDGGTSVKRVIRPKVKHAAI